jgi:hypothetical protein
MRFPGGSPKRISRGAKTSCYGFASQRGGNVSITAWLPAGVQGMGGVAKSELVWRLPYEVKVPEKRIIPTRVMIDLHGYDQDFVTTERALEMVIRAFHSEAGQLPATVTKLQSVYQLIWRTLWLELLSSS